jgi:16S rRNA processing protein RimM
MTEKMFNTGKIVNTHGVRGEVKVLRISDFEERFAEGETLYAVSGGKKPFPLIIDGHRIHKGFDLLHFQGYDNINDVEQFKNAYLKITEAQLTNLAENEYYYHEIIDCDVYTGSGDYIGIIREILSPGANDVWVVEREKAKDVLIPYIKQVVTSIDIAAKKVIIAPMEGLLD